MPECTKQRHTHNVNGSKHQFNPNKFNAPDSFSIKLWRSCIHAQWTSFGPNGSVLMALCLRQQRQSCAIAIKSVNEKSSWRFGRTLKFTKARTQTETERNIDATELNWYIIHRVSFQSLFVYLFFNHSRSLALSLIFSRKFSSHLKCVCVRVLHAFVKYLAKDNITNGNYNGLNTQMCLHAHIVCCWNCGSRQYFRWNPFVTNRERDALFYCFRWFDCCCIYCGDISAVAVAVTANNVAFAYSCHHLLLLCLHYAF